jgi:hypothetical protein
LAGNDLTEEAVVWSTLSIVALLGGTGLVLTLFGRYSSLLGWHSVEERRLRFHPPGEVALTPAQRSTAWYFFVVATLFFVQTLLGGATAHYHAETGGFFGFFEDPGVHLDGGGDVPSTWSCGSRELPLFRHYRHYSGGEPERITSPLLSRSYPLNKNVPSTLLRR